MFTEHSFSIYYCATYAGTGSLNLLIQTQKLYSLGSSLSGFYSAAAKMSLLPEAFPMEGLNFHQKLSANLPHTHMHIPTAPYTSLTDNQLKMQLPPQTVTQESRGLMSVWFTPKPQHPTQQ